MFVFLVPKEFQIESLLVYNEELFRFPAILRGEYRMTTKWPLILQGQVISVPEWQISILSVYNLLFLVTGLFQTSVSNYMYARMTLNTKDERIPIYVLLVCMCFKFHFVSHVILIQKGSILKFVFSEKAKVHRMNPKWYWSSEGQK